MPIIDRIDVTTCFKGAVKDYLSPGHKLVYLSQYAEVYVTAHWLIAWIIRPVKTLYHTVLRNISIPLWAFQMRFETFSQALGPLTYPDWSYWDCLWFGYGCELRRLSNMMLFYGKKIRNVFKKTLSLLWRS